MKESQVISLPYFPEIPHIKANRVITKHFTNAAMYLPSNQFSLLTWLIYQSKKDNTVVYSTQLLTKYSQAIKAAVQMYGSSAGLSTDIKMIRGLFKVLISTGYLLPNYDKKVFTVNPMLSYCVDITRKYYVSFCKSYQIYFTECQKGTFLPDFYIRDITKKYSELAK